MYRLCKVTPSDSASLVADDRRGRCPPFAKAEHVSVELSQCRRRARNPLPTNRPAKSPGSWVLPRAPGPLLALAQIIALGIWFKSPSISYESTRHSRKFGFDDLKPMSKASQPEVSRMRLAIDVLIGNLTPNPKNLVVFRNGVEVFVRPSSKIFSQVPLRIRWNGSICRMQFVFCEDNGLVLIDEFAEHPSSDSHRRGPAGIGNGHLNLKMITVSDPLDDWIRDSEIGAQFLSRGVPKMDLLANTDDNQAESKNSEDASKAGDRISKGLLPPVVSMLARGRWIWGALAYGFLMFCLVFNGLPSLWRVLRDCAPTERDNRGKQCDRVCDAHC